MCYTGGPRCSGHVATELSNAVMALNAYTGNDEADRMALGTKVETLKKDYLRTPAGIKKLRSHGENLNDPKMVKLAAELTAARKAEVADAKKRAERLKEQTTKSVLVPTSFGDIELTPGVLDENARKALTTGHCAAFALEIHKKTGWPVVGTFEKGVWDGDSAEDINAAYDQYDDIAFIHSMVRTPDGRLLDVEGLHTDDEYRESARNEHHSEVSFFVLNRNTIEYISRYCAESDPKLMASFVDPLLIKHGVNGTEK